MGIDISVKNEVAYTNAHQKLINCNPSSNPRKIQIQNLEIHCAFQRVPSRGAPGDGNPLMYALKGINGFSITSAEIERFCPDFASIVKKLHVDLTGHTIVTMPSSSPIAGMISECLKNSITGLTQIDGLLQKKTCGEVHAELVLKNLQIPKGHSYEYNQLLANLMKFSHSDISLKKIPMKFRKHIEPLKSTGVAIPSAPILLVDDLLATGATLISARDTLRSVNAALSVKAFCLLGKL